LAKLRNVEADSENVTSKSILFQHDPHCRDCRSFEAAKIFLSGSMANMDFIKCFKLIADENIPLPVFLSEKAWAYAEIFLMAGDKINSENSAQALDALEGIIYE
jgi:hypothetical protein